MPGLTNDQVVHELEQSKAVLQGRCNDVDGAAFDGLIDAIGVLRREIGAIEEKNLGESAYAPTIAEFDAATAKGKRFVGDLDDLKAAFGTVRAAVGAIDDVVAIIKSF